MGRWQEDARGRLEQAALALFGERGFESTTVAEIAARAGLTERTFFRYFADKREVLFAGASTLHDALVAAVAAAPDDLTPLQAVAAGLNAAAALVQERRAFARQRALIIAANAELRERELIKLATLAAALVRALRRRGVEDSAASLCAEVGMAVFSVAFQRWSREENARDLRQIVHETLAQLSDIAGEATASAARLALPESLSAEQP